MSRPEAMLEEFFVKRVRLLGGHTIKLAPTQAGTPDRLVMMPGGYIYLVEMKAPGGRLRPIQVEWHSRAAAIGVHVVVLKSRGEVVCWLRKITEENGSRRRRKVAG